MAVKIGPSGIALVGQFQNTISVFTMLATAAISAGVVKYLAEYSGDTTRQKQVITNALSLVLIFSAVISIIIIAASQLLAEQIFHTKDYWIVYVLFGVFLTLIALNVFFNAVFNGLKEIKKLTIINIISSVLGVILTVLFANYLGIIGVLIANNFLSLVIFVINIFFLKSVRQFNWKPFLKLNKAVTKNLFAFSIMTLISGLVSPAMQLLVRDKMINSFGIEQAGYWQGVTKISDYYLGFIITVLSVYYLPRLSEIMEKKELRKEIYKGYQIILPAVAMLAFAIFLGKGLIIKFLFTSAFSPMEPLFKYQLIGDFFKIGSWLLAYLMLAKAMTKTFIITEIVFSSSFVILSYLLMSKFGIIGTTYAFAINYLLYWLVMIIVMRKFIF